MTTLKDLKTAKLPKGFKRHTGGAAPNTVTENTRVQCAIMTVDGVRLGREGPAYTHIWEWNLHDNGFGAVVGFRVVNA